MRGSLHAVLACNFDGEIVFLHMRCVVLRDCGTLTGRYMEMRSLLGSLLLRTVEIICARQSSNSGVHTTGRQHVPPYTEAILCQMLSWKHGPEAAECASSHGMGTGVMLSEPLMHAPYA